MVLLGRVVDLSGRLHDRTVVLEGQIKNVTNDLSRQGGNLIARVDRGRVMVETVINNEARQLGTRITTRAKRAQTTFQNIQRQTGILR